MICRTEKSNIVIKEINTFTISLLSLLELISEDKSREDCNHRVVFRKGNVCTHVVYTIQHSCVDLCHWSLLVA